MTVLPWPLSQALTVTHRGCDITLLPPSTEFQMAQVIKFPIKRWESAQGRGIEQAHWLKTKPARGTHTAGAAAAPLAATGTHHPSLISSSFDYCLHQSASPWQLLRWSTPLCSFGNRTPKYNFAAQGVNLVWQEGRLISICLKLWFSFWLTFHSEHWLEMTLINKLASVLTLLNISDLN